MPDNLAFTSLKDGFGTTFAEYKNLVFSLGTLNTGIYTLILDETMNGFPGAAYDVKNSAVPLPAPAWLIGTILIGFAAFSVRRSL